MFHIVHFDKKRKCLLQFRLLRTVVFTWRVFACFLHFVPFRCIFLAVTARKHHLTHDRAKTEDRARTLDACVCVKSPHKTATSDVLVQFLGFSLPVVCFLLHFATHAFVLLAFARCRFCVPVCLHETKDECERDIFCPHSLGTSSGHPNFAAIFFWRSQNLH